MSSPESPPTSEREITLSDLLRDLFDAKWVCAALMLTGGLIGVAIGAFSKKQYEATIVLAPASQQGSEGGLGSLVSRYAGLASLAGVSVGGEGMKEEAIAVLQSQLLTENYIRENDLMPVLFADQWNEGTKRWDLDSQGKPPSLWRANRLFKNKIRRVTDDSRSGMILLSVRWFDPQQAAKWANGLVAMTNSYLRDKAIRETERNIAYLNDQLTKTSVVEAQKAIYSLLEDAINKEMIARGREEYALRVVDPAFAPEKPSTYGKGPLGLFGLLLGATATALWVLGKRVLF